jgi:hypothetical protein
MVMQNVPSEAAQKSYLLPLSDLTLSDRAEIRVNVQKALESNAMRLAIRDRLRDLVIRDALPFTDFAINGLFGPALPEESWLIPGPGVGGTDLQYFANAIAQDRVVAFFGVGVESAAASVSRVRLTLGPLSTETRGMFQLEQLTDRLEPAGYLSNPVVFTKTEVCRVMVLPRLAFAPNTERLHLACRVIEPLGTIVSRAAV